MLNNKLINILHGYLGNIKTFAINCEQSSLINREISANHQLFICNSNEERSDTRLCDNKEGIIVCESTKVTIMYSQSFVRI